MEILGIIRFKYTDKPFIFTKQGNGYAVEYYEIFSDKLKVRLSKHGYVTGYVKMNRNEWIKLKENNAT